MRTRDPGMKKFRIWDGKKSDLGSRIRNTGDKNTKVPIALGIRLRMQEKRQGFPITDTQTTKSSTFYQQIRAGHLGEGGNWGRGEWGQGL
jgi:hypothetical protein